MKKYYYVFPAIYLLVALIFLLNYVSSREQIRYSWGDLVLSIQINDETSIKKLKGAQKLSTIGIKSERVTIKFGKLNFVFNKFFDITDNNQKLTLTKIQALSSENGFSLVFTNATQGEAKKNSNITETLSNSVTLSFQTNTIFSKELALSVRSAKTTNVLLPFKESFGVRTQVTKNGIDKNKRHTIKYISPRGTDVFKILGRGYFVNTQQSWAIQSNETYFIMRYGPENQGGFTSIIKTPTIADSVKMQAKDEIKKYVEKMYVGLVRSRYDDTRGVWLQPEGVFGFSEDALAATFSEAAIRKEFVKYKFFLDRAAYLHTQMRTWRTATVLSENSKFVNSIIDSVKNEQVQFQNAMKQGDYSVLKDLYLFEKVFAFFNIKTQRELINFIQTIPAQKLDVEIATILLWQNKKQTWKAINKVISNMENVLQQIIVDNVVVANEGYLIKRSEEELDVRVSVLAGRYLFLYAKDKKTQNLGARIVITALQLSNDVGFLPRIFTIRNKNVQPLGFLSPEEMYFFLKDNPHYPHVKAANLFVDDFSNDEQFGILTVAPIKITYEDNKIHIDINVIQKETTQYAYIVNIKQPRLISAFETTWSGRYFVQSVSQGIYYDIKRNVIMVKISSQKSRERITLLY